MDVRVAAVRVIAIVAPVEVSAVVVAQGAQVRVAIEVLRIRVQVSVRAVLSLGRREKSGLVNDEW